MGYGIPRISNYVVGAYLLSSNCAFVLVEICMGCVSVDQLVPLMPSVVLVMLYDGLPLLEECSISMKVSV